MSFQALCLADRCGRRCLLISGAIGMFLSCVIMALVGLNKVEGARNLVVGGGKPWMVGWKLGKKELC